ncbi:alpha/beta fold hydrolase [Halioglobus maricola]|uniref:Alpha/beta fold hydrolase n=1 Tax=Halioglobus maricola TaxID=2601894 RepID=A0A5P9NQ08_9GAMM|nr:alpha/beta fold hydrolase [Halioglobus maricola]
MHFSVSGEGPPVVLMHGLFGAGNNLGALARSLAPVYTVYSLDLPNHGRSGWADDTSLAALAAIVRAWIAEQGLPQAALMGHSLGGKVAMEIALQDPALVAALVVADIAPVAYPPHHDAVFAALDAVSTGHCRSRADAEQLMKSHLREEGVIQFLLMSLQRGADGYYDWRFNLEGIKAGYSAVRAAPDRDRVFSGPVLFVKGGDSDYILPEHRERVLQLFPAAGLKTMPGCGHWLHAQQPALFNSIVGRFLETNYSGAQ